MKQQTLFTLIVSIFAINFGFIANAMHRPNNTRLLLSTRLNNVRMNLDDTRSLQDLHDKLTVAQTLQQDALILNNPATTDKANRLVADIQDKINSYQ